MIEVVVFLFFATMELKQNKTRNNFVLKPKKKKKTQAAVTFCFVFFSLPRFGAIDF
jgi:hypothetical protein